MSGLIGVCAAAPFHPVLPWGAAGKPRKGTRLRAVRLAPGAVMSAAPESRHRRTAAFGSSPPGGFRPKADGPTPKSSDVGIVRQRLSTRDLIKVCDQPSEHGDKLCSFLIR